MKIFNGLRDFISSNPKKFLFLVLFGFIVVWFLFDDYGLLKRIRMEAEHRMLVERYRQEQQRIADNERRIGNAHNADSIEKAARERYNFRREGETLYIIRGNK
ncbi:MAG: septum formation initiator [Chlorobium limicola]|uniref:Septum formation initiator n=1 Tax=Chlorobium limicola (strain DSM 245 / NBRC 103803 / 6330) TaxID=290315 RepID=B3EEQ3_CHLL2|nr:septum formation initiator family protein [Chlorobium limicola]ACD89286.1 Septum formation initiator [Chlorobium limicola DSM 245]NTV07946.1 septum formation initiator [Chlorobium limicola]NTV20888.1 septum formation initiator [Chlorobium limicola]